MKVMRDNRIAGGEGSPAYFAAERRGKGKFWRSKDFADTNSAASEPLGARKTMMTTMTLPLMTLPGQWHEQVTELLVLSNIDPEGAIGHGLWSVHCGGADVSNVHREQQNNQSAPSDPDSEQEERDGAAAAMKDEDDGGGWSPRCRVMEAAFFLQSTK